MSGVQVHDVQIEEVEEVTDELVDAWKRLLPQLSSSALPVDASALEQIVRSPVTALFMAKTSQHGYVGSLTLAIFRIPDGVRAWIEDVVVDENARGRGIGEALSHVAIERAREVGARSIDLTSNPKREAANRLYQRLGFVRRETNVYRFESRES